MYLSVIVIQDKLGAAIDYTITKHISWIVKATIKHAKPSRYLA